MLKEQTFAALLYFIPAIPFVLLELKFPVRAIRHRQVLLRDVGAYFVERLNALAVGFVVTLLLQRWGGFLERGPHLPLWATLIVQLPLADFTLYWVHRALHTRAGWPAHRWHHSPTHLYWFSGVRASLIHTLFYAVPVVWLVVFHAPPILYLVGGIISNVVNHWMHTNWKFRARWLEWILITPRAHHVHHSDNPAHFGRNYGALFSVWDRLFGTYLDPDTIETELSYGIPERVHPVRLFVGF